MDLARSLIKRGPFTPLDFKEANKAWEHFRVAHGAAATRPRLLTDPEHNAKFAKTFNKSGTFVYGLALAQASTSLVANVCRYSTDECRAGCVSFAGRGSYSTVQNGRIRRTQFLNESPEAFLGLLMREVGRVWEKHDTGGRVRFNTFSDIPWEIVHPELFSTWPKLRCYDYSKYSLDRRPNLPKNYRLIFSASEKTTDEEIIKTVTAGHNIAVVFNVKRSVDLPKKYLGIRVVDGDKSDDRYTDPRGVIVGLRAKGRMRTGTWKMARDV